MSLLPLLRLPFHIFMQHLGNRFLLSNISSGLYFSP